MEKIDSTVLFNIGYGLYLITCNDGTKDNGMIGNTVAQVTVNPNRVMVAINKANYSCEVISKSKVLNVNCLAVNTPFTFFQEFGMQSGRTVNKFENKEVSRSDNGLIIEKQYANSYMSLEVVQEIDLGSHMMFVCDITQAENISKEQAMSYAYYHQNVKPKPVRTSKKGWVCKICGYVYEGEVLPPDFICPICKHPASDFEPIGD